MSDLVERLRHLGDDLNKGYKDRRRKTCVVLREAADEIERLTAENKDLHEQVAALESKEVCTAPHDDTVIDGCPYCKIERLTSEIKRLWRTIDHVRAYRRS